MKYSLISTKGTQQVTGSIEDAIAAAKEMEENLQPAYGISIEDESGETAAEVMDGAVRE